MSGTFGSIAAFALVAAALCFATQRAPAQDNVFSGRVVDEDGIPIPGVMVEVLTYAFAEGPVAGPGEWETTSAADGTFTLQGLGPGTNTVRFYKEGFLYPDTATGVRYHALFFPRRGGVKEGVEIRMERPEFVSGVLVDESGDPVTGAKVLAWDYRTTTQADGSFKVPAPVAFNVTVTAPGYWYRSALRERDAPEPWTITLTKAPVVSGRVLDARTGEPVEGAHLSHFAMQGTAVSGPDGRYRLDQLRPDNADVLVWKDDLITAVSFDIYDRTSIEGADIRLEQGGTIEGQVTDRQTGQPIEGIIVRISDLDGLRNLFGYRTKTDADGHYRITGVLPGDMNVTAGAYGAYSVRPWGGICVHVEPGEIVTGVDLQIDRPLDPKSVPCITGQIVDDKGEPAASASVYVVARDGRRVCEVSTDITGQFSTATMTGSGLPFVLESDTPYDIEVHEPLLAPERVDNVVIRAEANAKGIAVNLRKGPCVRGTVRDTDGKPVAYVYVQACPAEAASAENHRLSSRSLRNRRSLPAVLTAQDGTYEISGLWPGSWMVGLSSLERAPTSGPREIQVEGEKAVAECDFTVRVFETDSIQGRVVDRNGVALPHVRVNAQCRELPILRDCRTDSQGRFRLDSVPKLPCGLSAMREDGHYGRVEDVEVGASDVVITAQFNAPPPTRLVHGRVVDGNREPITRFEVECRDDGAPATYQSSNGKFAVYMYSPVAFSVSAPGYKTKTVNPNKEALHGGEMFVVLEPEGD